MSPSDDNGEKTVRRRPRPDPKRAETGDTLDRLLDDAAAAASDRGREDLAGTLQRLRKKGQDAT